MYDSEHFLVIDLVVPFHWRQGFAVEDHWVLFLFSRQLLRKDSSGGKVKTVSLDAEGF